MHYSLLSALNVKSMLKVKTDMSAMFLNLQNQDVTWKLVIYFMKTMIFATYFP